MTAVAEANSPDPSRAREVARAINARGLTFVLLGATFFLWDIGSVWGWGPLGGILPFALFLAANRLLDRYYERRFGWVEPATISNRAFVVLMGTLIVLFFFGRYVESTLSDVGAYLDAMLSGSGNSAFWRPTAFWVLWLLLSGDNDRQKITFLASATTAVTVIGMLPLWFPGSIQNLAWKSFQAGWLGLSIMALGFYDHIRLLALLPKKVEGPRNE